MSNVSNMREVAARCQADASFAKVEGPLNILPVIARLLHTHDGESWRQAVTRVGRVLPDLCAYWEGARVLVIGHVATRWAFDHLRNGIPLEELIRADFGWREGWEYRVPIP